MELKKFSDFLKEIQNNSLVDATTLTAATRPSPQTPFSYDKSADVAFIQDNITNLETVTIDNLTISNSFLAQAIKVQDVSSPAGVIHTSAIFTPLSVDKTIVWAPESTNNTVLFRLLAEEITISDWFDQNVKTTASPQFAAVTTPVVHTDTITQGIGTNGTQIANLRMKDNVLSHATESSSGNITFDTNDLLIQSTDLGPALGDIFMRLWGFQSGNRVNMIHLQRGTAEDPDDKTIIHNGTFPTYCRVNGTLYVDPSDSGTGQMNLGGGYVAVPLEITSNHTTKPNKAYRVNNVSLIGIALPPSGAEAGDCLRVVNVGTGGTRITQASGQTIRYLNQATTTGVTGYIEFTQPNSYVDLMCLDNSSGTWIITNFQGEITFQ